MQALMPLYPYHATNYNYYNLVGVWAWVVGSGFGTGGALTGVGGESRNN